MSAFSRDQKPSYENLLICFLFPNICGAGENFKCILQELTTRELHRALSAFHKSSLNTWNFVVHVLLKPGLENFEHAAFRWNVL